MKRMEAFNSVYEKLAIRIVILSLFSWITGTDKFKKLLLGLLGILLGMLAYQTYSLYNAK